MKYRERGQGAPEENLGRDFRRELEDRERVASIEKQRERGRGRLVDKAKEEIEEKPAKRLKVEPQNLDADDPLDESDAGDSDSDSDDETAACYVTMQNERRRLRVFRNRKRFLTARGSTRS